MNRATLTGLSSLWIAFGATAGLACPEVSETDPLHNELMEQVRVAPDARSAQLLTNQLWEIWAKAPDAHSQDLLDAGIERRSVFDLDAAMAAFDALVGYCPTYAEGYNQRAFVLFIRQDYEPALKDLDRALARAPDHLGALTGRAMALMALGRDVEALQDLKSALSLNPWLKERDLVPVLEGRISDSEL
ncbi:tetratricopeptide repeat protein [Aliiruegeria lutimaris]|uniref:Uncharacterized protein n=1 Tax=Aliiruegeria lutimaris TaxID=571298 RepID=A0A1G8QHY6_9RHOB|nr:hypothetical protein [Aliiruegeria lutimaris]SDJ04337.1 hypothetical protein SAMN04488026_10117 [Aliiruegeria lutimaris]